MSPTPYLDRFEGLVRGVAYIEALVEQKSVARYYVWHPNSNLATYDLEEDPDFDIELSSGGSPGRASSGGSSGRAELAQLDDLDEGIVDQVGDKLLSLSNEKPGLGDVEDIVFDLEDSPTKSYLLREIEETDRELELMTKLLERLSKISPEAGEDALDRMGAVVTALDPRPPFKLNSFRSGIFFADAAVKVFKRAGEPEEVLKEVRAALEDAISHAETILARLKNISRSSMAFLTDFRSRFFFFGEAPARRPLERVASYRTLFPLEGCPDTRRFFSVVESYDGAYQEGYKHLVSGNVVGYAPGVNTRVVTATSWWDFYDEARFANKIHRGGDLIIDAGGKTFHVKNTLPVLPVLSIPSVPSPKRLSGEVGGIAAYVCAIADFLFSASLRKTKGPEGLKSYRFAAWWYTTHPRLIEVLSNVFPKQLFMLCHVLYASAADSPRQRENVVYFSNTGSIPGLQGLYRSRRLAGLPPPEHSLSTTKAEQLFFQGNSRSPPSRIACPPVFAEYVRGTMEKICQLEGHPSVQAVYDYVADAHIRTEGWKPSKKGETGPRGGDRAKRGEGAKPEDRAKRPTGAKRGEGGRKGDRRARPAQKPKPSGKGRGPTK